MRRYASGNQKAFRELFARYTARVHGYLLHSTFDRALSEDLAQQTWLRLHQARASFRDGARFAPWIYTIAANLRRDHARSRLRAGESLTRDGTLPEPPEPAGRSAAVLGAERDRDESVQRALRELPEDQREVILLHRWHDLGFAEIAEVLETSEGAVKVRAHRGYVKLREILKKSELS